MLLISRRRMERGGARFFCRGIDDQGNCGNFVESEIIFNYNSLILSFVQIRASIPLFWSQKQKGLKTIINLKRSEAMTANLFRRHLAEVTGDYQECLLINLISKVKPEEKVLSESYFNLLQYWQQ